MCGILAVFGRTGDAEKNRRELLKLSKLLRHRGPDANAAWGSADGSAWLLHERLTIIDVTDAGRQPFVIDRPEGRVAWCMNSEVYNHEQLREEQVGKDVHIPSGSDSAVLGYMYQKHGAITNDMLNQLDGIFAAALYDEATGEYVVARDPIGICPLYWGQAADGSMWFASEMKALQDNCVEFSIFPPGHVYRSSTGTLERWYNPKWLDMDYIPTAPADLTNIRESFEAAVVKRLMSDVPLGVLLSGGLDSSLVASIASRHFAETKNAYHGGANKLHTFSIGIAGSPDLINARKVAEHLGTEHHELTFTVEDGIDALRDLIWHIESFEQVRAAVPMYLLARKIKALGIKVVLSGEGADEAFGGYLYFHKAPNAEEFHKETVRKVERLHLWDVLRANKACFAWGLEPRVPFLDRNFLDVCMNLDPAEKMCSRTERPDGVHPRMEKYLLRKAFDTPDRPYLPEEVLWRQKEQFSDGVGYSWVDGLKDHAAQVVTDEMWAARAERFPVDPPRTREYYLLRSLFEEQFPSYSALQTVPRGLSVACSTPEAVAWDPAWQNLHEISGRAIMDVHDAGADFSVEAATPVSVDVQPRPAAAAAASRPLPSGAVGVRSDREAVVAKALGEGVGAGVPEVRVLTGLKAPSPLGRKMSPARAGRGSVVRRF